ncbi:MAG TPA: hypothetical protein PKX91_05675 [Clostridia bacterium]|jgi:uncharacterized membrane protein YozB (DUF420 family)|nr:hypothetical protein [Clostridia bacterium]
MAKVDSATRRKIVFCFLPLIMHVVLSIIAIVLIEDMKNRIPKDESRYWYGMILSTFFWLFISMSSSIFTLFPTIYMAFCYGISGNKNRIAKHRPGIIACIILTVIFLIWYLGVSIWVNLGSFVDRGGWYHYYIFPSAFIVLAIYLGVSIMYVKDFYPIVRKKTAEKEMT